MIFPFNLPGPAFLQFYFEYCGAIVLAQAALVLIATRSSSSFTGLNEFAANPYALASLRGGSQELLQVAVFNLVDRGLLVAEGKAVRRAAERGGDYARLPLDKAILDHCSVARGLEQLLAHEPIGAALENYTATLREKGLLIGEGEKRFLGRSLALALVLILGLGGARLAQAISRGHTNVGGLVAVTIVALVVLVCLAAVRRTRGGRRTLRSLRKLVNPMAMVARLRPGGATTEALLFAALYGMGSMPATTFAFVQQLFPRPASGDSGGSGTDSGGSSCGGGGGGCGGCGG